MSFTLLMLSDLTFSYNFKACLTKFIHVELCKSLSIIGLKLDSVYEISLLLQFVKIVVSLFL